MTNVDPNVIDFFNKAMDNLHLLYKDFTNNLDRPTIVACRCSLYDTLREYYHVVEVMNNEEDNK